MEKCSRSFALKQFPAVTKAARFPFKKLSDVWCNFLFLFFYFLTSNKSPEKHSKHQCVPSEQLKTYKKKSQMSSGSFWCDQGRGVISVLQTVWSHCGMRWGSLQPKLDSDGTSWEALTLPSHLKLPYPQKETLHIFSHGSHIKIHRSYAQTDITQIWETWGKKPSPWTFKRDVGLL